MRLVNGRTRRVLAGGLVVAASAGGCASGSRGGVGGAPSAPYVQLADGPEVVGTATLPNGMRPPAVLATAAVLEAFAWPITGADSARGSIDSDWQYFEPAVRESPRRGFCQNAMALRFAVRTVSPQLVRLAAEAYLPRGNRPTGWSDALVADEDSGRREALEQGRAVLASLRKAVLATGGEREAALRAWTDFGEQLDNGSFRRCAETPR